MYKIFSWKFENRTLELNWNYYIFSSIYTVLQQICIFLLLVLPLNLNTVLRKFLWATKEKWLEKVERFHRGWPLERSTELPGPLQFLLCKWRSACMMGRSCNCWLLRKNEGCSHLCYTHVVWPNAVFGLKDGNNDGCGSIYEFLWN